MSVLQSKNAKELLDSLLSSLEQKANIRETLQDFIVRSQLHRQNKRLVSYLPAIAVPVKKNGVVTPQVIHLSEGHQEAETVVAEKKPILYSTYEDNVALFKEIQNSHKKISQANIEKTFLFYKEEGWYHVANVDEFEINAALLAEMQGVIVDTQQDLVSLLGQGNTHKTVYTNPQEILKWAANNNARAYRVLQPKNKQLDDLVIEKPVSSPVPSAAIPQQIQQLRRSRSKNSVVDLKAKVPETKTLFTYVYRKKNPNERDSEYEFIPRAQYVGSIKELTNTMFDNSSGGVILLNEPLPEAIPTFTKQNDIESFLKTNFNALSIINKKKYPEYQTSLSTL